uniref:TNase-like domain-containing protein n=1 Tax=Trieres chinensis TaxID=1514140 RepID=A0A7S1Z1B2_TRICV|mmetsp:Transcript_15337/g.31328  ORF Transcript_15337/g.31328 Transcript_15337/m.31328 type:complete len:215 (+) Transcript_15337:88-732(+)
MGTCLSVTGGQAADQHTSPIQRNLPTGAAREKVRNVYDGDTLTLVEGARRLRLLGIDTPEIDKKQPYAEEAKQFTKKRCNKRDVWVSFEGNGYERNDKYGRLLAWVWTQSGEVGGGFLCVNEGLVAEGLATVYFPKKYPKLHNASKLIQMQTEARRARRGLWRNWKDYIVMTTPNGAAFHRRECRHLSKSTHLAERKASLALDEGLHACRTCIM